MHYLHPKRALPTDPPSLGRIGQQRRMFDPAPHRNRGQARCPELAPALMNRVIATAVAFGMPRREAEESRTNPYVRWHVAMLACMVWDAAAGDPKSIAALERIRVAFTNRGPIAEILAAVEQPPDAAELQALMGAD